METTLTCRDWLEIRAFRYQAVGPICFHDEPVELVSSRAMVRRQSPHSSANCRRMESSRCDELMGLRMIYEPNGHRRKREEIDNLKHHF